MTVRHANGQDVRRLVPARSLEEARARSMMNLHHRRVLSVQEVADDAPNEPPGP